MNEISCAQCGTTTDNGIYDELVEIYFCDIECFRDWADEHFEEVTMFYERYNLQY